MAKDPAFLFYPGDWLGGTLTFKREHKGAYMDLLMAQFSQRKLILEDIKTILGDDFETMWESKLKQKFKFENGYYFNEKLDYEIEKRKNFTASRRNNLSSSKHTENHMDTHIGKRMENGNRNENKDIINKDSTNLELLKKVIEYFSNHSYSEDEALQFFDHYNSQDWCTGSGMKITNWRSKAENWHREQMKRNLEHPPKQSGTPAKENKDITKLREMLRAKEESNGRT